MRDAASRTTAYGYDAFGNLARKSDVSATSFTYGTRATGCTRDPGPQAVSVAGDEPFCYDANGNMTKGYNFRSDTARTYAWTAYNKPSQIVESFSGQWTTLHSVPRSWHASFQKLLGLPSIPPLVHPDISGNTGSNLS